MPKWLLEKTCDHAEEEEADQLMTDSKYDKEFTREEKDKLWKEIEDDFDREHWAWKKKFDEDLEKKA